MKKFERKDKNEKRRVLLNNYHELSGSFDNEKLPKDNEAVQGNGLGVMAKLSTMTKKQLRALVAILVAVAVVIPGMVAFIVKGASAAEGIKLDTVTDVTSSGSKIIYTVKSGGLESNTYNLIYGGRTYVYDLNFRGEGSKLEEPGNDKLLAGDTLEFDTTTKKITWKYDPAHMGYTDVTTIADPGKDENDQWDGTLVLKHGNGATAAFVKDTTYSYFDENTGKYYLFSIKDDFIGYQKGETFDESSDQHTFDPEDDSTTQTTDYWYLRKLTSPTFINSSLNPITVTIDKDSGSASLTGDLLIRKQIYKKVNTLKNSKVYLIKSQDGKILTSGSTKTTNYHDQGNALGNHCNYYSTKTHNYFSIESTPIDTNIYNPESNVLFEENGSPSSTSFEYIDAGENEEALVLSEFYAAQKKHRLDDKYSYYYAFYLFGYDLNGDTQSNRKKTYTSYKTLGKIFHDTVSNVYLYDLCDESSRISYGFGNHEYRHSDNSLWLYDQSKLKTHYRTIDSDGRQADYYLNKAGDSSFTLTNSTNSTFELYERNSIYTVSQTYDGSEQIESFSMDRIVEDTVSPRSISYAETESMENGLELKKTVTENNNGTFNVKLESWTTSESLTQPDTDIVLLLDTSKNMNNTVYTRDYDNLNTYAVMTEVPLSQVYFNGLHDGDNPYNTHAWLEAGNTYSKRKYIEDPNNPGTFVYIAAKDRRDSDFDIYNNYTYTFTDYYGNIWTTNEIRVRVDKSTQLLGGDPVGDLEFHIDGDVTASTPENAKRVKTISSIYTRENNDNASYLNINLWALSEEARGSGNGILYYKHTDGKFYEVKVHRVRESYRNPVENKVYEINTKYTYSVTIDGETYTVSQGNKQYGADYGVFQGFRHYIRDNKGDIVLDENENNLLSKSLYVKRDSQVSVSAFQAMKESLEDFLLSAHYQAVAKKAGVNIALITYDKEPSVRYTLNQGASNYTIVKKSVGEQSIDNMISAIYNYSVGNTYASEVGKAMNEADTMLSDHNLSPKDNRRFAALFTAGMPVKYTTWGWPISFETTDEDVFDTGIAKTAIEHAYHMKNDLATTIYSVGLFDNADANKINGKYWYYEFNKDRRVACNGKVNEYWGGSWVANFGYSMDPKDAYATNRMLAYISSDYSDATDIGITRGKYSPGYRDSWAIVQWFTRGTGYRIDKNFAKSDKNHYFGISPNTLNEDADDEAGSVDDSADVNAILADVFGHLSDGIAIPNSVLDSRAHLIDGITEYFELVGDENDILVESVSQTNENDRIDISGAETTTIDLSDENHTIDVTGFNYSQHYTDIEGGDARKLVVSFDIQRAEDFIGGNDVPTNLSKSGVYDHERILEEKFDIPHADVSIVIDAITHDDAQYLGSAEYLPDLLEEKWFDGTNNAFVNIEYKFKDANGTINTYRIPAGESVGTWDANINPENDSNSDRIFYPMLDTTQFTVDCEVTPSISGTYGKENRSETPTVYVYQPHFDVHNDKVKTVPTDVNISSIPEISWKVHGADGNELIGTALTSADALIAKKDKPDYSFDIALASDENETPVVSVVATVNENGNYSYQLTPQDGKATVEDTTDYKVVNVKVVPNSFSYEYEGITEINYYRVDGSGESATISLIYSYDPVNNVYYDADGIKAADQAAAAAAVANVSPENRETVNGIITKIVKRPSVSASSTEQDETSRVTFNNTLDNIPQSQRTETMWEDAEATRRTNGEFTISLFAQDVTIYNEVAIGDNDADFRDTTSPFPLTLTLKDKNGDGVTKTYDCILPDGSTSTIEFNNGAVVKVGDETVSDSAIGVAHEKSFLIKQLDDGFKLSVASPLSDAYVASYQTGTDTSELADVTATDEAIEATIASNQKYIKVTQTMNKVVITGRGNADAKLNPFFIAAAVIALLGGSGTAYAVKRKKETEA